MLKSEIKVGQAYLIGGHGLGKAVILSSPKPVYPRSRVFMVDVEYPDAPPDTPDYRRKTTAETRNINRLWEAKDDERFKTMRERVENKRGWEEELNLAGYDGSINIHSDETMVLTFKGKTAERVLTALTGNEFPKEENDADE